MKFQETVSEVVKVGNIETNTVSIDKANIDFIITILSSNLYSNPIASFLRETISNAWDSHVEAGISHPIVVSIDEESSLNYSCTIRDYGVGLSKERFNTIYKNIGSSTKRGDNTQIGGFGIGRFSALAYSDMVNITSFYEGMKYEYVMYKDNNQLFIDLLNETPTKEANGLAVYVKVKVEDIGKFFVNLQQGTTLFNNVFVTTNMEGYKNIVDDINSNKIIDHGKFLTNSVLTNHSLQIAIGKVRYLIKTDNITLPDYMSNNTVSDLFNLPIIVPFEIGELEVTPNREDILYSNKNIATINVRIAEVCQKIMNDFDARYPARDYEDFTEFCKLFNETLSIEYDSISVFSNIFANFKLQSGSTFMGKHYSKGEVVLAQKSVTECISADVINTNKDSLRWDNNFISLWQIRNINNFNLIVCDISSLSSISKMYLKNKYGKGRTDKDNVYYIIKPLSLFKHYRKFAKRVKASGYNITNLTRIAFKHYMRWLHSKSILYSNASVPQAFIDEVKLARKAKRASPNLINWSENINLKIYGCAGRAIENGVTRMVAETFPLSSLKKTSRFRKLNIYGELGDPRLKQLSEALVYGYIYRDINIMEVAPSRIKLLKSLNLNNFIDIDSIMDTVKYPLFRKIATCEYMLRRSSNLFRLLSTVNTELISKDFNTFIEEVRSYFSQFYRINVREPLKGEPLKELFNEAYLICEKNNFFDEEMRAKFHKWEKVLEQIKPLMLIADLSNTFPARLKPFITKYLIDNKVLIPAPKDIKEMKESEYFSFYFSNPQKPTEDENPQTA